MVIQRPRLDIDRLMQDMVCRGALKDRPNDSNSIGMGQTRENPSHVAGLRRIKHGLLRSSPWRAIEPPYPRKPKFRFRAPALEDRQEHADAESAIQPGEFRKQRSGKSVRSDRIPSPIILNRVTIRSPWDP